MQPKKKNFRFRLSVDKTTKVADFVSQKAVNFISSVKKKVAYFISPLS